MRVPLQHLQSLVAGDGRPFHRVEALLEEARGGLVALNVADPDPGHISPRRTWASDQAVPGRGEPVLTLKSGLWVPI